MKILLGVSGSISAYRAVDILRIFQKNDHQVTVVLTRAATRFITPLTFRTFVGNQVYLDMFESESDPLPHINLPRHHDLLLVAPATANLIGKFAGGIADDLLSSLYLACSQPVVIAPAMNTRMLEHPAVSANLQVLKERGVAVIETASGELACEETGKGRLAPPQDIYEFCVKRLHV